MVDLQTLERQVLSLNIKERGRLASVLIRSLDEEEDNNCLLEEEIEELWIKEAIRRNKEMDEDPSIGIPAETVMSEMRELLK